MPKIIIKGKDLTSSVSELNRNYNTVYIGVAISEKTAIDIKEYKSRKEIESAGLAPCAELACAKYLLDKGIKVIYSQQSSDEGLEADLEKLEDKNLYNILFLYVKPISSSVLTNQSIIDVAKSRGDCIAILSEDAPESLSVNYTDGDYAGIFAPTLKTNNDAFADGDTYYSIPAGLGYLMAYANSVQTNPEYLAVAGVNRGYIEVVTGVNKDYTNAEIEKLQGRTGDSDTEFGTFSGSGINVISFRRGYGYRIWGAHTALNNNVELKATSFLNCKVLACIVKKVLYDVVTQYQFEQNCDVLWYNLKSKVTPVLDEMIRNNGISGYKFEKVATKSKARLEARLSLSPIEPLEDIKIEVELTDTLDVSDAQ